MRFENVVDRIKPILPPPTTPDPVRQITTDPTLGPPIQLPKDYIDFMKGYGPGRVMAKPAERRLAGLVQILDVSNFGFNTSPFNPGYDYYPESYLPSYPEVPGALIWGFWEQGFILTWEIKSKDEPWTIAIDSRKEAPDRYPCTFSEYFLYNILQQESDLRFDTLLITRKTTHIAYCPESQNRRCVQYFEEHPEVVVEFPIKPNP